MEKQFNNINATLDRIDATLASINSDVDEIKRMVDEMVKVIEGGRYDNDKSRANTITSTYDGEIMFRYKQDKNDK